MLVNRHIYLIVPVVLQMSTGAFGQSTTSAAVDWSGNYSFSSTSDKTLRLLQADILEKKEQGYYESLGKTKINQNTTVYNDNSTEIGQQTNSTEIEQQTNAIGAVNNSSTYIDIDGNRNGVTAVNGAHSTGCQDGSIDISSSTGTDSSAGTGNGSSNCN